MNEIIKISTTEINGEEVNSVDARTLHSTLQLKSDFSTWIKKELSIFTENIDYIRFHKKMEANNATLIEYILTLDTAKHVSMMQKNIKGKEVRNYFIEMEKEYLSQQKQTKQLPKNYIEALEALTLAEKDKLKLSETIQKKDEVILAVADLNIKAGDVSVGDFAKNLAIKGLGRNKMYDYLRARGFLMMDNAPYQPYVERGYFKRKPYEEDYGGEVKYKTIVTPRGCTWLARIIRAEFESED